MSKTIHRNSLLTAGIVLAAATACQTAEASSIPLATFTETAKVGNATDSSSTTGTVSEMIKNTSLNISADAFISAGADPSVEATVSAQDLGSFQNPIGTAFASMAYYFEVTGPDAAVIIHVKASGSYGGGNSPGANMTISGSEGTILDLLGHSPQTAASVDSDFSVNPNEVYTVNMFASAGATANSSITTISTAHIDPLITLTNRDPLGTTLSFSSNLGAPSSTITPEPTTQLTLGSGLLFLSLLIRRLRGPQRTR